MITSCSLSWVSHHRALLAGIALPPLAVPAQRLRSLALAVKRWLCYDNEHEHRRGNDSGGAAGNTARGPDRRARRRQETIEEILDIATEVMTEEGVNGLSLAEVARRLGVQPPSLYKYFPSLMAVYDALFRRGQTRAPRRHARRPWPTPNPGWPR